MKNITKIILCWIFFQAFPAFPQYYSIQTHFDKTNIPPRPDYSNTDDWAALPGKLDCADSTPQGLTNNQANAQADVFFIYPTTYIDKPTDKYIWNADVNNQKLNWQTQESTIYYQASLFNGSCRVYAPYYRQAHYRTFLTGNKIDEQQALDLAYQDVKDAFEYYLQHYNNNRPIVIASHSQGTVHAVRLLREFFMNQPLQKKLVVAYLVGWPVTTDTLPTIPPCKDSSQINCFTCWNTFERNYIPKYYSIRGLDHSVCTNPVCWTLDETCIDASKSKGAVIRPFFIVRPKLCDTQVHKGLLWTTKPKFPGSFIMRTPIYHVGDYNLFYLDVRENVELRIKEYLKSQ
jgi:hypothetical protein